jgi:hypothetical protein
VLLSSSALASSVSWPFHDKPSVSVQNVACADEGQPNDSVHAPEANRSTYPSAAPTRPHRTRGARRIGKGRPPLSRSRRDRRQAADANVHGFRCLGSFRLANVVMIPPGSCSCIRPPSATGSG